MNDIATVCMKARDLILRDGFITGGDGWHGLGGWCIEGALGAALGLNCLDERLSEKVNHSPAGEAIRHHLGMSEGWFLHSWNDRSGNTQRVLQVLAEVAAAYAGEPVIEEVAEVPTIRVLPPMPDAESKKVWFKMLLGV